MVASLSAFAYDVEVDGIYYDLIKKARIAEVTNSGSNRYEGEVTIPSKITVEGIEYDVTNIKHNAFASSHFVTAIKIPNSIISIEDNAFSYCTKLASITIPNSVRVIGSYAFKGCSSLKSITIPNSIKTIGTDFFCGCSSLTSIIIPNSVTSIEMSAFSGCSSLTSITILNSVRNIGQDAFSYCSSLKSITIPNSVISIDFRAFEKCYRLSDITLGTSIKSIKIRAFADCKNLRNVYCHATEAPMTDKDAFENSLPEYATLYIPKGTFWNYMEKPWNSFGTISSIDNEEPCAKPEISYKDSKITATCATDGAECYYEIKSADITDDYKYMENNEVSITACYDISCYAIAHGYTKSDVATAKLYWLPSADSQETNINTAVTRGVIISSTNGIINVSGLDENEKVEFFSADGKALESANAYNGTVNFTTECSGVIIVKIGKSSMKIIMHQ